MMALVRLNGREVETSNTAHRTLESSRTPIGMGTGLSRTAMPEPHGRAQPTPGDAPRDGKAFL